MIQHQPHGANTNDAEKPALPGAMKGRERIGKGPPPSKFFIEELKDVAARLYPNRDLEDEEDSSDDGGSGGD